MPGTPGSPSEENPPVDQEVQGQQHRAQNELHLPGQSGRVDHGQDVMLDEAALISRRPPEPTEVILQRGERTDPATELDRGPPQEGGNVDPRHARPSEYKESSPHHECQEQEVKEKDAVGEKTINHGLH